MDNSSSFFEQNTGSGIDQALTTGMGCLCGQRNKVSRRPKPQPAPYDPASSRRKPGPITPGVDCNKRHLQRCQNASPRHRDERNCAHAGVPARGPGRRGCVVWLHCSDSNVMNRQTSAFSRHVAPEFCKFIRPKKKRAQCDPKRDAGDPQERAQGRPGARCTRGLACKDAQSKTHTSIQVQRKHSGLPCAMVLRLIFALSPVRPRLACHRRPQEA